LSTLDYDSFTRSLKVILKLRSNTDDVIVREIAQAATRDIVREFDPVLDFELSVVNETEGEDNNTFSRIYLPDEALYLVQCYINSIEVVPVPVSDRSFTTEFERYGLGNNRYTATLHKTDDGRKYLQLIKTFADEDLDNFNVTGTYTIYSDDVSYIPEAYRNLAIYAAVKHYRSWYTLDNPAAVSKAEQNYTKYLAELRAETSNQIPHQKRPYEVEWKKMQRILIEGSTEDFYSAYSG
jgi:hypothetical protein